MIAIIIGFITLIIIAIQTIFPIIQDKKAKEKEKMADFMCKTEIVGDFSKGLGCVRIRFINVGKSNAENVRIEMLPLENEIEKEKFLKYVNENKLGPYELINSHSEKIDIMRLNIINTPKTLKCKITWDDGFANNRYKVISIDLY